MSRPQRNHELLAYIQHVLNRPGIPSWDRILNIYFSIEHFARRHDSFPIRPTGTVHAVPYSEILDDTLENT
ncbi:MAG: hypothetical protein OXG44_12645 [Gammaproteobacteria bacterium]|nr:hypothetical protein [Gammaproteobacteria bacterium]